MEAKKTVIKVAEGVKSDSLNFVVAGFSFASAVAWMDLIRWVVANIINVKQNGASYFILTALLTTLISVIVFLTVNRFTSVTKSQPVYAVTR